MDIETTCPACGEAVTLLVDVTAGSRQTSVEDCWVCCRPMQVLVTVYGADEVDVEVRASDE